MSASTPFYVDSFKCLSKGSHPFLIQLPSYAGTRKFVISANFLLKRLSWTCFAGSVRPSVMETKQKLSLWSPQLPLLCQLRLLRQKKTEQPKARGRLIPWS